MMSNDYIKLHQTDYFVTWGTICILGLYKCETEFYYTIYFYIDIIKSQSIMQYPFSYVTFRTARNVISEQLGQHISVNLIFF